MYLEVRVTAEMQTACRDCLNRNESHHSRLGRQGKASKAQLQSVVGLETGKGGGKEPWRSQASKKVEESLFQHSHRTLITSSNFIEKFNEQIIVVSNPFVPSIDTTTTPSAWVPALKTKGSCVYVPQQ